MDFFKSVFSEDPDPSNPTSLDQDQDQDQDQESTFNPNPNPNPTSDSESPTAWNLGGLLQTLASKSETVIQTYRRDLEEFGSGLKKETAAIREAATRAVKELPASIEVGASAAQESIESVGHVIDEFGSSVWRGTSDIISNSKESNFLTDLENNSKRYSRFEMQLNAIQNDLTTYCDEPDDVTEFGKWKLGFAVDDKGEEIENLLGENVVMGELYRKVVPSMVDSQTFWCRYYYRVYKLRVVEDVRVNLVKRAISGEEEDLSWDVDDEEINGFEAKNNEENKISSKNVMEERIIDGEIRNTNSVVESASDNVDSGKENCPESDGEEFVTKSDEKILPMEGMYDPGESSNGSDLPVVASQLSGSEEDIEWDEIEDLDSNDNKRVIAAGGPNSLELQKRLSTADDEEDLSWNVDGDDEPVKH